MGSGALGLSRAGLSLQDGVRRAGAQYWPFALPNGYVKKVAMAGVAQWIERRPVNPRAAGLIPSQGTCH